MQESTFSITTLGCAHMFNNSTKACMLRMTRMLGVYFSICIALVQVQLQEGQ